MPYVVTTVSLVTARSRDDLMPTAARGACPSVHDPFLETDGGLARVRLPAGVLSVHAARALADAIDTVGGTAIELTNRANLQVRGVPPESTHCIRDLLVAAGLVDADPDVDEHRNVLASPTAGIDPDELFDVGPFVAASLRCLAVPAAMALSPKFGVLVDGGGAVHVRGRAHDVAFGAVRDATGRVVFELRLAGALADAPGESRWIVEPEQLPALVDAVVVMTAGHGRVGALVDDVGADAVYEELARRVDAVSRRVDAELVVPPRASASPVGIRPQRQPGRASVGAIVPLGRITTSTLRAVAELADAAGAEALRVSPWRQLIVVGLAAPSAPSIARRLDDLGLAVDPVHPAGAVVACIGTRGCASAYTDTLTDAEALVERLTSVPVDARPGSVHISGCEKGCASPEPTALALVGSAGGTYAVHDHDHDHDHAHDHDWSGPALDPVERRFGRRVRARLHPQPAREAVVEASLASSSGTSASGASAGSMR